MANELTAINRPGSGNTSPRHWLVKPAPFRTSWPEIVRRGAFRMRGVRNLVARKHLSEMRLGDAMLYYHSQQELTAVCIMEVTREDCLCIYKAELQSWARSDRRRR
jgi:predicted RNA-binding protein with PUA-like domain